MVSKPKLGGWCLIGSLCLAAAVNAADWPQFRGPARDGISRETGWTTRWPDGGPAKLWEMSVGRVNNQGGVAGIDAGVRLADDDALAGDA
jgi:hypothetical protein